MDKTSDSQIAFGFKQVTFVTLPLGRAWDAYSFLEDNVPRPLTP
jgi:hypothetical protein